MDAYMVTVNGYDAQDMRAPRNAFNAGHDAFWDGVYGKGTYDAQGRTAWDIEDDEDEGL